MAMVKNPFETSSWSDHHERALEHADDWRKRAMFQTALANGAGLLALGSLIQNSRDHDIVARALIPSAFIFSSGLIIGAIAPFIMISRWESRAAISKLNGSVLKAADTRLKVAHLTNDATEVNQLIDEGVRGHGRLRTLAARASVCIGLSGVLFCVGTVSTLFKIETGALRDLPSQFHDMHRPTASDHLPIALKQQL